MGQFQSSKAQDNSLDIKVAQILMGHMGAQ